MDQIFHGVAVDGFTSFVPGESVTVDEKEEEEPPEDLDVQTPISISSHKRASNTSTTGSSPSKKSKSPAVRRMDRFMLENARIQAERNVMFQRHLENKQHVAYQLAQQKEAARVEKIRYVQQLARECGVDEGNKQFWQLP